MRLGLLASLAVLLLVAAPGAARAEVETPVQSHSSRESAGASYRLSERYFFPFTRGLRREVNIPPLLVAAAPVTVALDLAALPFSLMLAIIHGH
jgi:hypothetical protein